MIARLRLLLGISIFWLALSMLTDGVNTLVLPLQLTGLVGKQAQATALGLVSFAGLLAAALIQPFAGALSDRLRGRLGRRGFIALGLLGSLASLAAFAALRNLPGVIAAYIGIQLAASLAQAGQQGLIPDLVDQHQRGLASGVKGFMDIAGAMLGFAVLGQALGSGQLVLAIGAIAAALVAAYLLAVMLTPEDHPDGNAQARTDRPFSIALGKTFSLDLQTHAAFFRVLTARFLFLLGIYATGRFLLYFVADRLRLAPDPAAKQAGTILAALALVTILASPIGGWLADRIGRIPLMVAGALLGAASSVLLIGADSASQILMFGSLMSVASAAFSGGSWALLADLVPADEPARYFGIANFSTAGAAALAGLLGPLLDGAQRLQAGGGYTILFVLAALAFLASAIPFTPSLTNEVQHAGQDHRTQEQARADGGRLAVHVLPAHPAGAQEDQDPQAGRSAT